MLLRPFKDSKRTVNLASIITFLSLFVIIEAPFYLEMCISLGMDQNFQICFIPKYACSYM